MRFIRVIVLLVVLAAVGYYVSAQSSIGEDSTTTGHPHVLEQNKTKIESKEVPEKRSAVPLEGDIYQWMTKSADELEKKLGEPLRKDLSAYGYERWLYTDGEDQYVQFGIKEHHVASVYALGNDLAVEPVTIGQTYEAADDAFNFSREITYDKDMSSYTFRLNDADIQERPLVKVSDNVFLQLYFDTSMNELSAVRLLSADILLLHQPYEIKYRGDMPEDPEFTDDQWTQIEEGAEQQIFYLTNVVRYQHEKSPLKWDESVSDVAYEHSRDMAENHYFSHYSQDGDGLKERLAAKEVFYQTAGENIAAQYPDAESALHGWMNSEDHRKALLNDDFTHLGAGVHRSYYTQNFLNKD
ncbi:CAP domain-containing protein [Barrientosiimonas marina]|uniref:CAP domain-containing protein n=1 Tax=Lentibacillus kimchii TaxID=1542911 RepID=A0ABW2UR33_9BACI